LSCFRRHRHRIIFGAAKLLVIKEGYRDEKYAIEYQRGLFQFISIFYKDRKAFIKGLFAQGYVPLPHIKSI